MIARFLCKWLGHAYICCRHVERTPLMVMHTEFCLRCGDTQEHRF